VAGLIAGFYTHDLPLIGRCITDLIVEPARAPLIPGFLEVKQAALDHGALGCSISGAGPAVFAITDDAERGQTIGQAMATAFAHHHLRECRIYVSHINCEGAKAL
jgi:homoserine kinase